MEQKLENLIENNQEFKDIIKEIRYNPKVLEMQNYRQHFSTNCYSHSLEVSFYCYKICKKLHLDYISATRGAMLHDMFLYDWHEKGSHEGLHAFTHPKTAYENASKIFELNEKEKDIILKHMWPVCFGVPKHPESFIITLVDKYCATKEGLNSIRDTYRLKKAIKNFLLIMFVFKK